MADEQLEIDRITAQLVKFNTTFEKLTKAVEKIADEMKSDNSNNSPYTTKAKIAAALKELTHAVEKLNKNKDSE